MDANDRKYAQPQIRKEMSAKGIVLVSDATLDSREAADFIAPVDAGWSLVEDFNAADGDTPIVPWTATITDTAGTAVADFVANAAGGQFKLGGDSQSEAQTARIDFGDHLVIDSTKNFVFEARVQVQYADDTAFTADERLVIGLASAYNATLDSVAKHAWFRVEGADTALLLETDDGATDNDDEDVGQDLANDSWAILRIEGSDLDAIKFYRDGVLIGDLDAAALSGNLQPMVAYQRDAGADEQVILIDYIKVWQER